MPFADVCRSLFDEAWYRNAGEAFEGDAYEHFATIGWRERRDPHPLFDVAFYLEQVPELLIGDENPIEHYVRAGTTSGMSPHLLFDTRYYLERYGDRIGDSNPLLHYLRAGGFDGFEPGPFFASSLYRELYNDVRDAKMNPLVHYVAFGGNEWDRLPHPFFDARGYARRRKLADGVNPLMDFVSRIRLATARYAVPVESPDVSAIVLNLNRAVMTLACVLELLEASEPLALEVVVVDNGSSPLDFDQLVWYLPPSVKLVRVPANRYFGEGNNLGVEASAGRCIAFINNDAFVEHGALAALHHVLLAQPDAGAVGPKFLYPDGRLQECGGMVSSCGSIVQRGKFLDDQAGRFSQMQAVDYVSAACLMMRRSTFEEIGGFDLMWDPAYYEDVDLCLKLKLIGLRTYYVPEARVTHVENATSSDTSHGLQLHNVVQINREKFIARWGEFIEREDDASAAHVTLPPPERTQLHGDGGTAVLYTSYALVPGGGERYLLTIAQLLSRRYRTYVITPHPYSSFRLRTMAAELDLDLSRVRLESAAALPRLGNCDVFIAMGNEALPPLPAMGRRKIYICQFPFPIHPNHEASAWATLDGYDDVVVYSGYASQHFHERAKRFAGRLPPVTVLPPASPMYGTPGATRVPGRIVNVGRFTPAGHCKRQDILVDAFRMLYETSQRKDLELHLVGTVHADPSSREYYVDVHRRAEGLPVIFHLNAPASTVREIYDSSSFYWHATGYGQSASIFPERMEHFGISVVEAMSAGAVPLVFAAGGPAHVVTHGVTGMHWRTLDELVRAQVYLLDAPDEAEAVRATGMIEAHRYDDAAFEARFSAFLGVELSARTAAGAGNGHAGLVTR